MLGLETKDYFTIGIGSSGLILSLLIWARTLWRERRHVDVAVSPAYFVYANGEISTQMASIDVVNRGNRPAYVQAPTLRTPNGKFLSFVGSDDFRKFPLKLEDGQSASLCVSHTEIARTLKKQKCSGTIKLYPSTLDATGKRHWGKRWKFDVDKGDAI